MNQWIFGILAAPFLGVLALAAWQVWATRDHQSTRPKPAGPTGPLEDWEVYREVPTQL